MPLIYKSSEYLLLFTLLFSCNERTSYLDFEAYDLLDKHGELQNITKFKDVQSIKSGKHLFCIKNNYIQNFDLSKLEELDFSGSNLDYESYNCQCIEGLNYLLNAPNLKKLDLTGNSIFNLDCIQILRPIDRIYLGVNNIMNCEKAITWINKGLVKELNLSGNKIDSIPNTFLRNNTIRELYLNFNRITKIPPSISNLQKLELLSLRSNFLDSIPKELSELKNLKYLDLSKNRFKTFPSVLFKLTNLKEITLQNNQYPIINDSIYKQLKIRLPDTEILY